MVGLRRFLGCDPGRVQEVGRTWEPLIPLTGLGSFSGPTLLLACLVLLFCIFGIRLWYLQVYKNDFYTSRAQQNRTRQNTMFSPRGIIRDRNGLLLAENTPAYALALIREDCPDIPGTLDQVSKWTGQPRDELQKVFEIGPQTGQAFRRAGHRAQHPLRTRGPWSRPHRQEWPGLTIAVRPKRFYTYGPTLAHILGYVARANEEELNKDSDLQLGDDVGKQGVELVLERRLRGHQGP